MTRNITLSADEKLIAEARKRACAENTSLNIAFRDWLYRYAHGNKGQLNYVRLMKRFSYANAGKRFSRDEMNER